MANIKSAAKRARQAGKRRDRNNSVLSGLKSSQKRILAAVASGKLDDARAHFVKAVSALDKAAKRGVIHKNAAHRRKSVLNRALKPG